MVSFTGIRIGFDFDFDFEELVHLFVGGQTFYAAI